MGKLVKWFTHDSIININTVIWVHCVTDSYNNINKKEYHDCLFNLDNADICMNFRSIVTVQTLHAKQVGSTEYFLQVICEQIIMASDPLMMKSNSSADNLLQLENNTTQFEQSFELVKKSDIEDITNTYGSVVCV